MMEKEGKTNQAVAKVVGIFLYFRIADGNQR
jgi:hypothetical protein